MSGMNRPGVTIAFAAIGTSGLAINMMQQCPKCNEYHSTVYQCSALDLGKITDDTMLTVLDSSQPQTDPDSAAGMLARIAALEDRVAELATKIEQMEGGK